MLRGAIQTMSPLVSLARKSRPSGLKATAAGRPCRPIPLSQPNAKSNICPVSEPEAFAVELGKGRPVAGSIEMATRRAPVQLPAAPWDATYARLFHGSGHIPGSKRTPHGVSPIRNPLLSGLTPEQSGVEAPMSRYGWPGVAQQG